MDKSEPVAPTVNDSEPVPPKSFGAWLSANLVPLIFVAAVVALIIWRGLVFLDVAIAVLGLGLVIFIHELGHFLAAKLCDVHVETFSIGFGRAIPGCQFRRGETTYKIGWIPLGGYVKMVGEGENADTEEAEEDPRSFKNKSVWQRMIIISAGVVMNLILGCVCFMGAYSHGVEETPAIVGRINVGSPAWQQDVRIGDRVVQIDDIKKPTFDDIRPTVMSREKNEPVLFKIVKPDGAEESLSIIPRRNPEDLYPVVGIVPIDQLVLSKSRRGGRPPCRPNTPAAEAVASDGSHFQGGDRIVATSDPLHPAIVKPIAHDPQDPTGTKLDTVEFLRNQFLLRGQPMTVRVDRGGTMLDFVVGPAWTQVFPGVRFQMGRVAAMRADGPAAHAQSVDGGTEPGFQTAKLDIPGSGDRIIAVEITQNDGKKLRYVDEFSPNSGGVKEELFDPLKLPYLLEVWAKSATDRKIRITVLRAATGAEKTGKRVAFDVEWDPALVFNGESLGGASTPLAISGLGLAYYVDATVDSVLPGASADAGLLKGDIVTKVRLYDVDDKGETKADKWLPLKQYQAVALYNLLQQVSSPRVDLKIKRATPTGDTELEITLSAIPDKSWAAVDRGFNFPLDTRIQQADDPYDALKMGLHRTWRTVIVIYQTLYATIFREISTETLSGPLTIANASYKIAGYDLWQFILFIGLININLAVVNFLPIPLLDGGHMVFLIYEKIRGKPAPERIQAIALYAGLVFILLLMAFVIFLDVRKLFF